MLAHGRGVLLRAEVFLTYATPMHSAAVRILDSLEHMHVAGVGGVASASCLVPSDRRSQAPPKHLPGHLTYPAQIRGMLEQCVPTVRAAVPRQPLRACSGALGMQSAGGACWFQVFRADACLLPSVAVCHKTGGHCHRAGAGEVRRGCG